MMDPDQNAKIFGVISGAFLALVFIPPKTKLDAVRRTASALVFGWVFGHLALGYFEWERSFENLAASYAVAAGGSWWIMGSARKFFSKNR